MYVYVMAQALSDKTGPCMPLKNVVSEFSTSYLLWKLLLLTLGSQIPFHLTLTALPAYESFFPSIICQHPVKKLQNTWSSVTPMNFYLHLFPCLFVLDVRHQPFFL